MQRAFFVFIAFFSLSSFGSCMQKAPYAQPGKQAVLNGTVIQKPWRKSFESWNAGGSEYYVLDVGNAPVVDRTAKEGVLLLAPEGKDRSYFKQFIGKQVRVEGYYYAGKEYKPTSPMEQHPSSGPGQKLIRGSGFKVIQIQPNN